MSWPNAPNGPRHDPVTLRPATPADSEFSFQLHKAAMSGYITAIWGWDEQRQCDCHTRKFNPGHWQITTTDGTVIGMIDVEYRPAEIYLSRIEIHPGYQGRGIGTRLSSQARRQQHQDHHAVRTTAPVRQSQTHRY